MTTTTVLLARSNNNREEERASTAINIFLRLLHRHHFLVAVAARRCPLAHVTTDVRRAVTVNAFAPFIKLELLSSNSFFILYL
jgi:hypothetical protein